MFKPVCIVRETGSLRCKIIGTYCVDLNRIYPNQKLPDDFIWPLDANRHEENVRTIRQLIKDNPVDQLPYVDENLVQFKPFTLDDQTDSDEEPNANMDLNCKILKKSKLDKTNIIKDTCNLTNQQYDSNKRKQSAKSSVRPSHCPYCLQRFSATFNAKLHFNGRKNGNGYRISCPVARRTATSKTLEPILCAENCMICYELEQNRKSG